MLKGGQKKLDANKDGKISGDDFAMLRNVRMQKKDAMGEKVVSEKMKLGGMNKNKKLAKQAATAIAMKKAGKKPMKKMMGGGMMKEPMGYKMGGGVRGGRKEIKGLRPAKLS